MTESNNKSSLIVELDPTCGMAIWFIYLIETPIGHWYTGITTDVERRFKQHQSGKGAKNLRGKTPLKLVFSTPVGTRSEASKLEAKIKSLSKINKRQWVAQFAAVNTQLVTESVTAVPFVDLMPR
ncbi:GIY-YIG nuclease family protein [Pseudoalteromonas tunicata]|nr:GIY-YIG nuclease family protein [Pseudoalteromonas tunicata]ATC93993.1 putative endonuclease [Pseudoalteromonas tunicata]